MIWCEDHGELAYYRQSGAEKSVSLDAGDWVQFDVTTERKMRYAHNPRLVAEGVFDGLAQSLGRPAGPAREMAPGHTQVACPAQAEGAEIIRFSPAKKRRTKAGKPELSWV
ncbi:hypothetical protein [Pseudodonghicola flavimaris]|uniref:Uncharacterized protein n=1 Tax=Pseudodonghicola flavimaris TaxID=3050036 RepID=A0ABT7EVD8_9RHOB|nr:hypothetical protein [Pseudodonghicola flavimaris]MDK3016309.1 hypothetical protein [Pseudodonghicola flavimaris]